MMQSKPSQSAVGEEKFLYIYDSEGSVFRYFWQWYKGHKANSDLGINSLKEYFWKKIRMRPVDIKNRQEVKRLLRIIGGRKTAIVFRLKKMGSDYHLTGDPITDHNEL